jgi:hypothetical protein
MICKEKNVDKYAKEYGLYVNMQNNMHNNMYHDMQSNVPNHVQIIIMCKICKNCNMGNWESVFSKLYAEYAKTKMHTSNIGLKIPYPENHYASAAFKLLPCRAAPTLLTRQPESFTGSELPSLSCNIDHDSESESSSNFIDFYE